MLHKGSIYCRVIGLHNNLEAFLSWCWLDVWTKMSSYNPIFIYLHFCLIGLETQDKCFSKLGKKKKTGSCLNICVSPVNWWRLRCSPWSPGWLISSCIPSSAPMRDSSHIAVVWRTYHTAHCSTSQRTVLRGEQTKKMGSILEMLKKLRIFWCLLVFLGEVLTVSHLFK